ncbi:hypothetical protein [Sphingobacterium faecium]|uniref:hypothetical protein n=1 Tax=Sphingobacterium faecium TaxID=34087 RepID=UPI0024791879|nr:hypothetical protein [Sphingobacterium faecium]WGQ12969.1 hypothetical protein QG727_13130 [Sphingobacterium faecium]
MMKQISSTKKQNAMIGYLVSRLKLDDDTKEEIIYSYTDGRTTSIRELQFEEAKEVIKALTSGHVQFQSPANKMRRKILSMAHEMSWELPSGKIDMQRVNNWCINYGYLAKRLDKYTDSELPALVSAFENMYLKHLKGI